MIRIKGMLLLNEITFLMKLIESELENMELDSKQKAIIYENVIRIIKEKGIIIDE